MIKLSQGKEQLQLQPWLKVKLHPVLAHLCSFGCVENHVGGSGFSAQPAAHDSGTWSVMTDDKLRRL